MEAPSSVPLLQRTVTFSSVYEPFTKTTCDAKKAETFPMIGHEYVSRKEVLPVLW